MTKVIVQDSSSVKKKNISMGNPFPMAQEPDKFKRHLIFIACLLFFGIFSWFLFISSCYDYKSAAGIVTLHSKIVSFGPNTETPIKYKNYKTLDSSNSGTRVNLNSGEPANSTVKQVCYYWIPRENGTATGGMLSPRDLDPDICSHIIIDGGKIQNRTIAPLSPDDTKVYQEVMRLKEKNPNLRVLFCLGGDEFSSLVRDPNAVGIFAFNAQQFLVRHGFDGLDLDWEFPGWPAWQKDRREKKWFTYLVMQLNNALKLASHPPLMLTLAVGSPQPIVDGSYEVQEIAKYVDFVSIMGYDYHMYKSYMPFTGHNAPLFRNYREVGFLANLNIEWSANYWLKKGMPLAKIVIGIPTYGRTWKLLSEDWYNVGAPAVSEGMLAGELSFTEACIFVKEGASRFYDRDCQVPYSVRGRDWVSYEDAESISAKAQWIRDGGFAGVMTWNLNCDDWAGLCSGERFMLHKIIKNIISV